MNLFVIRPIRKDDESDFIDLVASMRVGIASLPNNPDLLKKKLKASIKAFNPDIKKTGREHYLFILEDVTNKAVAGICGLYAHCGRRSTLFAYEMNKEYYRYEPMHISKEVEVLHFKEIKNSPSEVCSLYLKPEYRNTGIGKLLSLSRYLFIQAFPDWFQEEIMALLRGYRDEKEQSPFFETIGKVFFDGNLQTVDAMKSLGHKKFIRALMPKYPLYAPLLQPSVGQSLGKVYSKTEPALHLLEEQGFKKMPWIDIFDAGPYLKVKQSQIKTIKEHCKATISKLIPESNKANYLISNHKSDYRACLGHIETISPKEVGITENALKLLELKIGKTITYSPL